MGIIFNKKKDKPVVSDKNVTHFSISNQTMPERDDGRNYLAEDISLITKEWLSPNHILYKTRYTKRQVRAIVKLQPIADRRNIKPLKIVLDVFRTAKLSEGGETSKELVNILGKRFSMPVEELNKKEGVFGKYFT